MSQQPLDGLGAPPAAQPPLPAARPPAAEPPPLFIAHCPGGHVIRGDGDAFNRGRGWLACGCGMQAPAQRVDVQERPRTPCGPRCHRAKGAKCHCACVGRNHGAALTYSQERP